MSTLFSIARAYVTSRPRQTFVSVLGVTMGVGFYVGISALMQGFQEDFIRRIVDISPHVIIRDEFRLPPAQPVAFTSPDAAVELRGVKPRDEPRGIRSASEILGVLSREKGLAIAPTLTGQAILRYGGKKAAILTLVGDMLKGVIPVVAGHLLKVDAQTMAFTLLGAFLGHLFPLYFGFKGGKGVATAAGVLIALNGWVGLALIAIWLVIAFTTRYSSLSGIVATFAAPALVWWFTREPWLIGAVAVMSAILLWRHKANIQKLLAGTEPKIGKSK